MGGKRLKSSKAASGAAIALALCLAGCPSAGRGPPGPAPGGPSQGVPLPPETSAVPPAPEPPPAPGMQRHRIDPAASLLVIVARRGGALASIGHNHVIASHDLSGYIDLAEPAAASAFYLRIAPGTLTVDEPALRAGRGAQFEAVVPEEARAATRRNMLGEDLLDAARHPQIFVRGVALDGGPQHFAATVELTVRAQRYTLAVPVRLEPATPGTLRISSSFPLAQSALGLTPFSVMLGALRVEDLLEVELDLTARRVP